MREKLIDIITDYADFLDWERIDGIADTIMEKCFVTDNNVGKWISVKERLPDKNMKCLCSYVFNENTDYPFEQVLYYFATCENPHFQHEGELGLKVTHWMPIMPLPEPPKGE